MKRTPENIGQPERRSFLKGGIAFIGGLISFAIGVPLIGFAISPALKKGSKKWVDVGIVDLLKGSRYKKINYTFQSKDGWVRSIRSGQSTSRIKGTGISWSSRESVPISIASSAGTNPKDSSFVPVMAVCLTKREMSSMVRRPVR